MRLVCWVDDEWPARTASWLADHGAGIAAVVLPAGSEAATVWRRLRRTADVAELVAGPGLDLSGTGAAAMLVIGSAVVDAVPELPRLVVTATGGDGLAVTDPVHWCLRAGDEAIDVRLHLADRAAGGLAKLTGTRVDLTGLDYRQAAAAVAAAVHTLLATATVADQPDDRRPGSNGDRSTAAGASGGVLPIDRRALRIDWNAGADAVARLVRSASGRHTQAWTYLAGFPVSVGRATVLDGPGHDVPPGTVLASYAAAITVQTGRGVVAIAELSDAVGRLPHAGVAPGMLFGIDAAEELRSLRRRVADLERTVRWALTEGTSPAS